MPVGVNIRSDALDRRLKNVIRAYGAKRFLDTVSLAVISEIDKNFRTESSNGEAWKKFKFGGRVLTRGSGTLTIVNNIRRFINPNAKLLRKTGRLAGSFGRKFSAGNTRVIINSNLSYAKYFDKDSGREILPNKKRINQIVKKVAREISNRVGR